MSSTHNCGRLFLICFESAPLFLSYLPQETAQSVHLKIRQTLKVLKLGSLNLLAAQQNQVRSQVQWWTLVTTTQEAEAGDYLSSEVWNWLVQHSKTLFQKSNQTKAGHTPLLTPFTLLTLQSFLPAPNCNSATSLLQTPETLIQQQAEGSAGCRGFKLCFLLPVTSSLPRPKFKLLLWVYVCVHLTISLQLSCAYWC